MLYFSSAVLAMSTESCCISSDMSAFLMIALPDAAPAAPAGPAPPPGAPPVEAVCVEAGLSSSCGIVRMATREEAGGPAFSDMDEE